MPESITFTWHDVAGEARPSPTTRKKFEEWRKDIKDPDRHSDCVYYMDFLRDVIGDLQKEYNSHLTPFAEDSEESRKRADLETKGD